MRTLLTITLCATLLSGCALGPDYVEPKMDMPDSWNADGSASSMDNNALSETIASTWWTNFGDVTLDSLVDDALKHNDDLAIAMANVDVSRANLTIATSYLSQRCRQKVLVFVPVHQTMGQRLHCQVMRQIASRCWCWRFFELIFANIGAEEATKAMLLA